MIRERSSSRERLSRDEMMNRIIPEPNSGCWIWLGHVSKDGYGKIGHDFAHRRLFEEFKSRIPAGLHVLHRCDTPICVNPAHLFLGDRFDNMRDMVRKGRHRGPNWKSLHAAEAA